MTTADRTDQASFPRFVSLIGHVFRRFVRARLSERGAAESGQEEPPPTNKLEELAAAHFVHDMRNHLTVMMGCAASIFRLVPSGRADQDFADLQQCAERASRLSWQFGALLLSLLLHPREHVLSRWCESLTGIEHCARLSSALFSSTRVGDIGRTALGLIKTNH
jgi:hypothetical protein